MNTILKYRLSATLWSYIASAYAYAAAFLCNQRSPVEPVQLLLAPVIWLLHMGLVLFCTFSGGRGSWNHQNTISATVKRAFKLVIAHLDLSSLDISGTQVRDLSPLTNMNLEALYIYKTPIIDLTPVAHMAPRYFGFSEDLLPEGPNGTDVVRGWTNCTINMYSNFQVFWKEYVERKQTGHSDRWN